MMFDFLAGNRYFYDFKWSNHFSDGFIEFYGKKYVYSPNFLVCVHMCVVLGVKLLGLQSRGPDP